MIHKRSTPKYNLFYTTDTQNFALLFTLPATLSIPKIYAYYE